MNGRLPSGAICNLDCKYCFFLSKEALYPDSRFRMSEEVLEPYNKQVIESQRSPHVTIAWQGGEPTLMELPFFRRAMELVNQYLRPGMTLVLRGLGIEPAKISGLPIAITLMLALVGVLCFASIYSGTGPF